MNLKMERRKCALDNCKSHFSVLQTSKQKFHSDECRYLSELRAGKGWRGEANTEKKAEPQKEFLRN